MSRPVAYVAGKYTANSPEEVEQNVMDAALLGAKLTKQGYAVLMPHCNSHLASQLCHPPIPYQDWLDSCCELMSRCDLVVLLPGWQHSNGANVEAALANKLGIPTFEWNEVPDVSEWEHDDGEMVHRIVVHRLGE
jgi:hypothetical protein